MSMAPQTATRHSALRHAPPTLRLITAVLSLAMLLSGLGPSPALAAAGSLELDQAIVMRPAPGGGQWPVLGVLLRHVGGTSPAEVRLQAQLPAEFEMAAPPEIDGGLGGQPPEVNRADGTLRWNGGLAPDSQVRLSVPLRRLDCSGDPREAIFRARAAIVDGAQVSDELRRTVNCESVASIDKIVVSSTLISLEQASAELRAEAPPALDAIVPGVPQAVRITFTNNNSAPVALGWSWGVSQTGLARTTAEGSGFELLRLAAGESQNVLRRLPAFDFGGQDGEEILSEELPVVISSVAYCLLHERASSCPAAAEHPDQVGQHELEIPVRPNDLGDAPDSQTNHFGAPMRAYPAVQAGFPTVFDPTTGQPSGPLHARPRPFHLGERVSLEAEADIGPDQEGFNNINPPGDAANLDRYDDGIRPGLLAFNHCQTTTFNARVFIHPAAQAALINAGIQNAYINVWVDGNRDGDWADAVQCPAAAGLPAGAVEHIVIDQPVAIAGLAAGLNTVPVSTGRVPWPAAQAEDPSWLRITLSLEPSTKTLQAGNIQYGDGRGHYVQNNPRPFRTGETEDYLLKPEQAGQPDVAIIKRGRLLPGDPSQPGSGRIVWSIEYQNRGDAPAENVVIRDRLDNEQSIIAILIGLLTRPERPHSEDGDTLVFNIGRLEPGERGRIVITTEIPDAERVHNLATITAAADADETNNRAEATVALPLPAPIIVAPGDGTTCAPEATFRGRAIPGATVALFDRDNAQLASVTADGQGRWQAEVELDSGRNRVTALARLGNRSSAPSEPMQVFVDTDLPYDPLSMRLSDDAGNSVRPVDADGRSDDGGWILPLEANTNYSFSVRSCCDGENARILLTIGGDDPIELIDPDGDDVYTGIFNTGPNTTPQPFSLTCRCNGVVYTSGGTITLRNRGMVIDADSRAPIEGATLILQECLSSGICVTAFNVDNNPQETGADGKYLFQVPPGRYRMVVSRTGYYPFVTRIFDSFDERLWLNIALTRALTAEPTHQVTIDNVGFGEELLRVRPGDTLEIVNADVWEHAIVSPRDAASGLPTGRRLAAEGENWESGLLAAGESYALRFDEPGVYSIQDSESGATMSVIVGDEQPADEFTIYLPLLVR